MSGVARQAAGVEVGFTIEGSVSGEDLSRLNLIAMAAASATGNAVIIRTSEIPTESPSVLLEWVRVDADIPLWELAVTRDGLVDFTEAEFSNAGLGVSIYTSITGHYYGRHDVLLRSHKRLVGGTTLAETSAVCECPLEVVRSPYEKWRPQGFRPRSFVHSVEAGVKFVGVGDRKQRVLNLAAECLRGSLAEAQSTLVRHDVVNIRG